jgi:hypothetical protein
LIVAAFVDPCTGQPSVTDKVSVQQDWCWAGGEGLDVYAYDANGAQIGHQFVEGGGVAASFQFDSQIIARLEIYHIGQGIDNLSFTLPASLARSCDADIAPPSCGDGVVGPGDLGQLLSQWGVCSPPCGADLFPAGSGDGVVGPGDLGHLLSQWGVCR